MKEEAETPLFAMSLIPYIILASSSPRRAELLRAAGIGFEIRKPTVDERRSPGEQPVDYVARLAREKTFAVTATRKEIVLGADTTVCVDGHVLEKPADADDARRMLGLLSGRDHQVLTGICLCVGGRTISDVVATTVRFLPMTPEDIEEYTLSGEPMDKAGAYGIQGLASKWVERIDGCYFNVVGLPVSRVWLHLRTLLG